VGGVPNIFDGSGWCGTKAYASSFAGVLSHHQVRQFVMDHKDSEHY